MGLNMARDPSKTEEIRIYCTPETKADWQWYCAIVGGDNQQALQTLLEGVKESPEEIASVNF